MRERAGNLIVIPFSDEIVLVRIKLEQRGIQWRWFSIARVQVKLAVGRALVLGAQRTEKREGESRGNCVAESVQKIPSSHKKLESNTRRDRKD